MSITLKTFKKCRRYKLPELWINYFRLFRFSGKQSVASLSLVRSLSMTRLCILVHVIAFVASSDLSNKLHIPNAIVEMRMTSKWCRCAKQIFRMTSKTNDDELDNWLIQTTELSTRATESKDSLNFIAFVSGGILSCMHSLDLIEHILNVKYYW